MTQVRTYIREALRKERGIQFTEAEIRLVAAAVAQFRPCRFLVFGVGNDSSMWQQLNRGGATVFLEHNAEWIDKIRTADASLDIRPVDYSTRITRWREFLDQPHRLAMDLPRDVRLTQWDVILVDAPNGFVMADEYPGFGPIHGRMQSIQAAQQVVALGGYVFVHDAEREVENASCITLLSSCCRELFRFRSRRNTGRVTELRCFNALNDRRLSLQSLRLKLLAMWLRLVCVPDRQHRWKGSLPFGT